MNPPRSVIALSTFRGRFVHGRGAILTNLRPQAPLARSPGKIRRTMFAEMLRCFADREAEFLKNLDGRAETGTPRATVGGQSDRWSWLQTRKYLGSTISGAKTNSPIMTHRES